MNKAKKVLALVLALAMCMSLVSSLAFADNTGDIDNGEGKTAAYNIVCIGDEYANGYGLPGYGQSKSVSNLNDVGALDNCATAAYVRNLGNTIQKALGAGYDVKTSSLCFNGARAEELKYILEGVRYDEMDAYGKQVVPTYDEWFADNKDTLNTGDQRLTEAEYEKLGALEKLVCPNPPYTSLQDYAIAKIKAASLIVMDLGTNDFGTYLINRLEAAFAWAAGPDHYYTDEETGEKELFFTKDYSYFGDDPEKIHGELALGTEDMLRLLVDNFINTFETALSDALTKEIADAFTYAFFNYCVSVSYDIAYLRTIAPLSQIIVVGATNALNGAKISLPYPKGEAGKTMDFDLGAFWQTYIGIANSYLTNSKVGTQFKFCDLSTTEVETMFDELTLNNELSPYYKNAIIRDFAYDVKGAREVINNYPVIQANYDAMLKNGATSYKTVLKACEEYAKELPNAQKYLFECEVFTELSKGTAAIALIESNYPGLDLGIESVPGSAEAKFATGAAYAQYQAICAFFETLFENIETASCSVDATKNYNGFDPDVFAVESIKAVNSDTLVKAMNEKIVQMPGTYEENEPVLDVLNLYSRVLAGTGSLTTLVDAMEGEAVIEPAAVTRAPFGTLPSAKGHEAKLQAVLKSWVTPGNADSTGEDSTLGVFTGFFKGILGSFKVPILDTINNAFRNFMKAIPEFFTKLFNRG